MGSFSVHFIFYYWFRCLAESLSLLKLNKILYSLRCSQSSLSITFSNPRSRSPYSLVQNIRKGKEIGFIMEFAENLILRLMEDPKERDRKFREHVYATKARCDKTKEMWSYPLRPYDFWTFDRHNAQNFWDPQISQVAGRRDPYDDLLQDGTSSSTSK